MKPKSAVPLLFSLIFCSINTLLAQRLDSVKVYNAASAKQAVAADEHYLYAIGNAVIEKYDKQTGKLVKKWEDQSKSFKHLNSGVVIDHKLYCAHSNFPDIPMASSIEIFDTESLMPIASHSFGIAIGSATWIDFYDGHWYIAFAHYDRFKNENGKDNTWTQLVKFTPDWQRKEGWILPMELIEEFGGMSNSGGFISKDGKIFLTGHDYEKVYLLEFPSNGYQLKWTNTFSAPFEGQGIAVDPSDPTIVYGIARSKQLIYKARFTEKDMSYHRVPLDAAGFNGLGSFNGFNETETLFTPVSKNQGMATDGKYLYVSPDHHTIEKRNINDFTLLKSATYEDKIGGLFYDSERGEILTCSGQYITGGNAFISRINKNDLTMIESIDISTYTKHGINAIVRLDNKIYVGETAVGSDAEPKSWYAFDPNFRFIGKVFSHTSEKGSYDWQDATVYHGTIYANDHNGFVFAFRVLPNGQLSSLGSYNSLKKYPEGITHIDGVFLFWRYKEGIVSAKLK